MDLDKNNNTKNVDLLLDNAKATLAVEGLTPSKEVVEITKKHLDGELSENDAIDAIDKFIKEKYLRR
jgi:hypothetical protein